MRRAELNTQKAITRSPSLRVIAVSARRRSSPVRVYCLPTWTVPVSGGPPRQLTFDKELAGFACWSPDGKFVAYQIKRGDDAYLMIMPSDGGESIQLTSGRGRSWPYDFSPDGDKIVFAGDRDGVWNVWWVSRSTKMQKQLTNYTKPNSFVRYPAWSPLGNQIAYEYAETAGNIWLMELK